MSIGASLLSELVRSILETAIANLRGRHALCRPSTRTTNSRDTVAQFFGSHVGQPENSGAGRSEGRAMPRVDVGSTNQSQLRAISDWGNHRAWREFHDRYEPFVRRCVAHFRLDPATAD